MEFSWVSGHLAKDYVFLLCTQMWARDCFSQGDMYGHDVYKREGFHLKDRAYTLPGPCAGNGEN